MEIQVYGRRSASVTPGTLRAASHSYHSVSPKFQPPGRWPLGPPFKAFT